MPEFMSSNEAPSDPIARKIAASMSADADYAIKMQGRKDDDGVALAWGRKVSNPPLLKDYVKAADTYLDIADPLDPTIVDEHIRKFISQESHLKDRFPQGWECCPSIIFCSTSAAAMNENEKAEGFFIQDLIVDKDGNTVKGYAPFASNIGRLIPAEMLAVKFTIPKYDKEGYYDITDDDRTRLEKAYRVAIDKLRETIKAARRK